jgi:hypothetical protein
MCHWRSEDRGQDYTLVFGANKVLEAVEIFGFARALLFPALAPTLFILRDLCSALRGLDDVSAMVSFASVSILRCRGWESLSRVSGVCFLTRGARFLLIAPAG